MEKYTAFIQCFSSFTHYSNRFHTTGHIDTPFSQIGGYVAKDTTMGPPTILIENTTPLPPEPQLPWLFQHLSSSYSGPVYQTFDVLDGNKCPSRGSFFFWPGCAQAR